MKELDTLNSTEKRLEKKLSRKDRSAEILRREIKALEFKNEEL